MKYGPEILHAPVIDPNYVFLEKIWNVQKNLRYLNFKKQGRIHGYPSRVRVGRVSDGAGHWSIWAGAVSSKCSKTPKKLKGDQPTNQPPGQPTDGQSGV